MDLLIESYQKFMRKKKKYFKYPNLVLDRWGFIQIHQEEREKGCGIKELIADSLKVRNIKSGHIVWRTVYNGWGLPWAQIWYREKILDEYGNEVQSGSRRPKNKG